MRQREYDERRPPPPARERPRRILLTAAPIPARAHPARPRPGRKG